MDTNTNTLLLAWRAPSRSTHERSERWYLVGGVFCLIFIAYGILTGAWSLSIVFATIAGLYFLVRGEKHREHTIALYDSGIEFDSTMYRWEDCKEFWILEGPTSAGEASPVTVGSPPAVDAEGAKAGPAYHELHVAITKKRAGDIVIQTGSTDPYLLRDLLGQYIPQTTENHEKILDWLIRSCKL